MKWAYAAAMLLAVLATPSIWAAAEDTQAGEFECNCEVKDDDAAKAGDPIKAGRAERVEAALEKILSTADVDNNGVFDENEKAAVLKAIVARHIEHAPAKLQQFDADKDGKFSDAEREAARKAISAALHKRMDGMLKQFDTDKDGKLSAAEFKAAHESDLSCSCKAADGGAMKPQETSAETAPDKMAK